MSSRLSVRTKSALGGEAAEDENEAPNGVPPLLRPPAPFPIVLRSETETEKEKEGGDTPLAPRPPQLFVFDASAASAVHRAVLPPTRAAAAHPPARVSICGFSVLLPGPLGGRPPLPRSGGAGFVDGHKIFGFDVEQPGRTGVAAPSEALRKGFRLLAATAV